MLQCLADRLPGIVDDRSNPGLFQLLPGRHADSGTKHRVDIGQQIQHGIERVHLGIGVTVTLTLAIERHMTLTHPDGALAGHRIDVKTSGVTKMLIDHFTVLAGNRHKAGIIIF